MILDPNASADNMAYRMFQGAYTVKFVDADDNEIETVNVTIQNPTCDLFGSSNRLQNADFDFGLDDWQDQGSAWLPGYGKSWREPEIKPGMVGNGMYVYGANSDMFILQNLTEALTPGTTYHAKFHVKIVDADTTATGIMTPFF